jgi:hypothetical protein
MYGEVHTGFWRGNVREGDHLEDRGADGRMILNRIIDQCIGRHGPDRCGLG